jgi:ABC-type oligopeptide transport system ATPase subunit
MKFGVRLSVFAKEVLRHYPSLRKKGKILNIFGLSGSGKSTVYQLLRPMLGTRGVVCIDDDAARYGLFAKPIFDLETNAGTSLGEIRQHLLHNAISDTFYILLDFLTQELRSRGYVVIRTSTIPLGFADQLWYVEHPDGVDPRVLRDDDVVDAVKKLVERTSARTAERDTYPWKKARRVLEFSQMLSVDLRLSERPHTKILQSLIRAFRDRSLVKRVQVIRNLPITDVRQRRQMFVHQLRDLLKK